MCVYMANGIRMFSNRRWDNTLFQPCMKFCCPKFQHILFPCSCLNVCGPTFQHDTMDMTCLILPCRYFACPTCKHSTCHAEALGFVSQHFCPTLSRLFVLSTVLVGLGVEILRATLVGVLASCWRFFNLFRPVCVCVPCYACSLQTASHQLVCDCPKTKERCEHLRLRV